MNNTRFKTPARWGCFASVILLLALVAPLGAVRAQSFDVSGFVKSSYYYDTRQIVAARDVDFLLYPTPNNPDADDPSDRDNLSAFPFFSRLGLGVNDFDQQVLGADVSGYFESDFFGPTGDETNTLRIRRAFAKMVWDNREVQFGVEWSPLFTLAAFPHTVATEAGAPFNPFGRQPMMKLTLKPNDNLRLIGIAAWQIDAFVDAPLEDNTGRTVGLGGIDAQQQSGLPGLHGHLQYVNGGTTLGLGGHLKTLRPFPTGDTFTSGAGTVYGSYSGNAVTVRGKVVYGGVRDHVGLGGYILDSPGTPDADYKQINTLTTWLEVEKPGTIAPGLFAGYLTNLGVSDELNNAPADVLFATRGVTPVGQSVASVWEIAPRIALNHGPLRLAFELQATTVQYTGRLDENFAPDPTDDEESVTNLRGDFTVFLFF